MASFALLTKKATRPIRAEMPARIQPNTGIDLMATPTARNAPARVKFATAPAVAAAVCPVCAAVLATCAVVLAVAPAVLAACAPAFASLAAVLATVAAVFAVVAAASSVAAAVSAFNATVSAVSAVVAAATTFAHHSLRPRNVVRENAESLFNVSDTCCNPMVIAMTD